MSMGMSAGLGAFVVLLGCSSAALAQETGAGCSDTAPIVCDDETAYHEKLTELGYSTLQEGFESDAVWGSTRFPNKEPSVLSGRILWRSNGGANWISTSGGSARSGLLGMFSNPHGTTSGGLFDPQRDGFVGTATGPLVAVGGFFVSNSGGAQDSISYSTIPYRSTSPKR